MSIYLGKTSKRVIGILLLMPLLTSCVSGYCRTLHDEAESKKCQEPKETVKVFKYDDSRQCGMGAAVPLEVMEKELVGIKAIAREHLSDGMMRMQLCGASTGMANVYTIPYKELKKAEDKGFRIWKFDDKVQGR